MVIDDSDNNILDECVYDEIYEIEQAEIPPLKLMTVIRLND